MEPDMPPFLVQFFHYHSVFSNFLLQINRLGHPSWKLLPSEKIWIHHRQYWQVSLNAFLPAATKLGQGNIFTSVCLSTGGSTSVHDGMLPPLGADAPPGADTPWDQTPLWDQTHPPGADTPPLPHPWEQTPPTIWSMSGWYASHWNAFLL